MLYSSNVNTLEAWADRLMGERRGEIWSISPHHNLRPGLPPISSVKRDIAAATSGGFGKEVAALSR